MEMVARAVFIGRRHRAIDSRFVLLPVFLEHSARMEHSFRCFLRLCKRKWLYHSFRGCGYDDIHCSHCQYIVEQCFVQFEHCIVDCIDVYDALFRLFGVT